MAEPVGLLGTVVGVVSLGLQVYGGLKEYLDTYKSRDKLVEKALKRLQLLQQSLSTVESIIPTLESKHPEPANAVVSSLQEVQTDLQALHDQLEENKPSDPTNLIEKVKEKKKKLAFPFRLSDIYRLDSTLEKIINNLLIAMHGLGLNMSSVIDAKVTNIGDTITTISPQLDAVNANVHHIQAAQAADIIRQADVQSILDSRLQTIEYSTSQIAEQALRITPSIQSVHADVLKLVQIAELAMKNQGSSPNSETLHRTVTSMMVAKPALLRTASDTANLSLTTPSGYATTDPQDSGRQDSTTATSRNAQDLFSCNCRPQRHITRKSSRWLLLPTFEETITESRHKPWCSLFQPWTSVHQRRFGFLIAGLHRYSSTAISVSLYMTCGAGGRSISPTIRYFGIVDQEQSPAFRVVNALTNVVRNKYLERTWTEALQEGDQIGELIDADILDPFSLSVSNFQEILHIRISKLQQIFRSGAALPTDVDENGYTAIHRVFRQALAEYHFFNGMDGLYNLHDLLQALLGLGIPCSTPAELTTSHSIVDLCFKRCYTFDVSTISSFSTQARRFISEDIVANLLLRETSGDTTVNQFDLLRFRDSLAESKIVAEALGFDSPFYTALLHRNENDLRYLLRDPLASSQIERANGPTLAHMTIGWPTGLKLLLEIIPTLDVNSEYDGESPFVLAMQQSRLTCPKGQTQDCEGTDSCTCDEPVKILLEAGCHLTYGDVHELLRNFGSTRKAISTMFEHIKMWRDRLKALLFEHIPEMKLSGKYDSSVLDLKAGEVIVKLERRGIFPYQKYNMQLDDYRLSDRSGATIYHFIRHPSLAEKAFELGFRDLDEHWDGQTPLMKSALEGLSNFIFYINWLIAHGASYTNLVPYKSIIAVDADILPKRTVAHLLPNILEWAVSENRMYGLYEERLELDCVKLFLKSPIGDGCKCGCSGSSDGCYPITVFLNSYFERDRTSYGSGSGYYKNAMWICKKVLDPIIKKDEFGVITEAVLRAFTFSCLMFNMPTQLRGLRHTCCINLDNDPSLSDLESYVENHRDVRKGDQDLLCKLDDLVAKFTEQFLRGTCSFSEFIQGYWVPRMKQVMRELKRSFPSQEEMMTDQEEEEEEEEDEEEEDEYYSYDDDEYDD